MFAGAHAQFSFKLWSLCSLAEVLAMRSLKLVRWIVEVVVFTGLFCPSLVASTSETASFSQAVATQPASAASAGQTSKCAVDPQAKNTDKDARSQKQWIKVVVTSSRPEIDRGATWGVTADITNTSTNVLCIDPSDLQVIVQPEVWQGDGSILRSVEKGEVILEPQTHYMFSWYPGTEPSSAPPRSRPDRLVRGMLDSLSFVPGPYVFTVEGKVRLYGSPQLYHTFAESLPVKLTLEQLTISLWAGFGAIIAFLVTLSRRPIKGADLVGNSTAEADSPSTHPRYAVPVGVAIRLLSFLARVASAFLLGSALSVVTNRLADTQFPLKVAVNDIWGAISVGFVFYFVGNKIIDKLVASISDTAPARTEGSAAASTHPRLPQSHLHAPGSQTA